MQKISTITDKCIHIGYALLALLVPLLLTPVNYELFEYNKMMAVYGITAVIVGAWVSKMIVQKRIFITKTPFDIPIILFVLSQLVSTLFSIDPHVSWFGYYSRFNGGMLSIFCYTLLFYAFTSNVEKTALPKLGKFLFSTAVVVSLYGVLEHFGIDKHLWVQDVQARIFSTLGQPNWLAAYVVALIPITLSIAYARKSHWPNTIVPIAVTLLYFITLLYTRSRSGLIAFLVIDLLFWMGSYFLFRQTQEEKKITMKQRIAPILAFHLILGIFFFFTGTNNPTIDRYTTFAGIQQQLTASNAASHATDTAIVAETIPIGPVLETGGTESGVIRKYVWQGAINAWNSSRKTQLIGTGTETFAFAFYQNKPVGHNLTSEWDFLYNKAHNEYLNYLATTGIFGLGAYLSFLMTVLIWSLNQIRKHKDQTLLVWGILLGWLSILITNFFGFSVVVTQLLLFLMPGALFVTIKKDMHMREQKLTLTDPLQRVFLGTVSIAATAIIGFLVLTWIADKTFATGYRLAHQGQYASSYRPLQTAIALNPNEPLYHDEYASVLASLSVAAMDNQDATLASTLAAYALAENNAAIAISPNNVNYWKSQTKIYYALTAFDETLVTAAIQALTKAERLSPADPKIAYNLAILSGRTNDADKAIHYLKHAIDLKPNYRDAYYALFIFYTETKQTDLARTTITTYLTTVDSQDEEFKKLVE
ncbi:MAG: O-antigen ligase family protein [Microgenomates group bacterium]